MKTKKSGSGRKTMLVISMLLFCGTTALFAQSLGDVNKSGVIDIVDALQIAQYYVGIIPANFTATVADVNCSGGIDIVDALIVAQYYVGLLTAFPCTRTPTAGGSRTATPAPTPSPAVTPFTENVGVSTYFYSLGGPYGGCGLPQAELDSQNFIAVNVQNTPGDYTTFYRRPFSAADAKYLGFFNNGLNCGRWVRVTIGDYCNGDNDGAMNQPFCRNGTGWAPDAYNGATLDMILGDSCQDGNAWCRDDPNHLDLAEASLNKFVKNGVPVGDMSPNHYNNRKIAWHFIEAPNYTGDIRIGFLLSAQLYWPSVAFTHLKNGIHGVDCWDGTAWVKATMNGDLGQAYILVPTTTAAGAPGNAYRIRIYDVNDKLINNGRVYNFLYPASCGTNCSPAFTEVTYTVE